LELGLAESERGATGRRPRTTYRITEAGRTALAGWLGSAPGGFALEHEPLLRVFLSPSGTRADLLAAVARARDDARAMLAIAGGIANEYLAGTHEFQEHVHIRQFTFDYLSSWATLTVEWADRTEAEVRRWRDVRPSPAKHERALQRIARLAGRR
jgi:DNA-binding PadR family transcriptional regulator